MPFLEILTRTYKRPTMLATNMASLARQTSSNWVQTLLRDDVGRGIGWSYDNMAAYAPNLVGEFIWILDDDDMCLLPRFVEALESLSAKHKPDVIMVRMDHGSLGVLPSTNWQQAPIKGDIGCSAYVVRREVWQAHAHAMMGGHYASDYDFIKAIFASGPRIYWYNVIASRVQRRSMGAPE